MSSTFGIYALVCTIILFVYLAVQITRDIFGKNGKKAESEDELFDNSEITGFSQEVNEGGERGYHMAGETQSGDDSRFQPQYSMDIVSGGDEGQQQNTINPDLSSPGEVQSQEDSMQEDVQQRLLKNIEDVKNHDMNVIRPVYQDMYDPATLSMLMNKPMEYRARIHRELINI